MGCKYPQFKISPDKPGKQLRGRIAIIDYPKYRTYMVKRKWKVI